MDEPHAGSRAGREPGADYPELGGVRDPDELARLIRAGNLPVPFKRYYGPDPVAAYRAFLESKSEHLPSVLCLAGGARRIREANARDARIRKVPWGAAVGATSSPLNVGRGWLLCLGLSSGAYELDIIPDLYTEEVRLECNVARHRSPAALWRRGLRDLALAGPPQKKDAAQVLAERAWEMLAPPSARTGRQVAEALREGLYGLDRDGELRFPECNQFKASLSAAVYRLFAEDLAQASGGRDLRVLDPCAGWGDRALGAGVAERMLRADAPFELHYTGVDPNRSLEPGHRRLADELGLRAEFHYEAFEDWDAGGRLFDLVFTSPPFSHYEVYEAGPDRARQSSARHPTHEGWIRGWMQPALAKMASLLRPGGYLVLYVKDTSRAHPLTEPMRRFVARDTVLEFQGTIPCLVERPGAPDGVVLSRPMPLWVWKAPLHAYEAELGSRHPLRE